MKTCDWDRAARKLARSIDPDFVPSISVSQAIAEYLDDARARGLQSSTVRSYEKTLEHFQSFCDVHQFASLEQLNLEGLTLWRQSREIEPSTQRKEIESLRAFFAFAMERKWLSDNWAKRLRPPLERGLPTMPYEQHEVEAIIEACSVLGNREASWSKRARLRARSMVLLLLYSGLRISDACKLERTALDRSGKLFLRRQQKTGTPVYVKLPEEVSQALNKMPKESKTYWFWNERKMKLATLVGNMRRTIQYVLKKAQVKGHPHRFRDTFAVRMLEHDVPIRTVQILLGHSSVRTTEKHYAPFVHSQQKLLDEAVGKLDFLPKPKRRRA